jgi:hypothetical protein
MKIDFGTEKIVLPDPIVSSSRVAMGLALVDGA